MFSLLRYPIIDHCPTVPVSRSGFFFFFFQSLYQPGDLSVSSVHDLLQSSLNLPPSKSIQRVSSASCQPGPIGRTDGLRDGQVLSSTWVSFSLRQPAVPRACLAHRAWSTSNLKVASWNSWQWAEKFGKIARFEAHLSLLFPSDLSQLSADWS